MGGLILDNIAVFCYWLIRQAIINIRTRKWPTTIAVIDDVSSDSSMYPQSTAFYHYIVNGEEFYGQYDKGFWYRDSAYRFAIELKRTASVAVRYDPEAPSRSYAHS